MRRFRLSILLLLALSFLLVSVVANQPMKSASEPRSFVAYAIQLEASNTTQNQTNNITQPTFTNELTIDRVYYRPTNITLNYPSTTNTLLGNVTTIAAGQYNYAGDDKSFTFWAKDVDVYTFSYTISYANATQHDILITVWEGDRAPQGATWTAIASSYTILFRLTVVEEPSYPSAPEVARESLYQFQQMFQQEIQANQQNTASTQASVQGNTVLMIIAVILAIVAFLFAADASRARRKALEDE